ncbi:hypothetical protein [Pseudofrankia inefficax]|uniref:hypothetical protein n=1 Tax=Pseudofrankia inefficax (strain DSM 45817 / CECT 9037 / DDB 130130 / EuI1c) TaxID=298654 RepID=UPI0018DF32E0|nr:hypothetical protein [Pseudofrankia inefficax]
MRLTGELEETAVAGWYRSARFRPDPARRESGGLVQRLNWQTRTRYYETLVDQLRATGGTTDGLARDELAAAAGQRRPSTLYYLVSPRSPGSLAGALVAASPRRLYEKQRGERVLDLLVAETKVWSYWPHREGWLGALDDLTVADRWLAAASLIRVVADWAMCSRSLATAASFAPPVAAVEDLLRLADGGQPGGAAAGDRPGAGGPAVPAVPGADRAGGREAPPAARRPAPPVDPGLAAVTALLTTVVRTAVESSGIGPAFVLAAVHPSLTSLVSVAGPGTEKITAEVADVMTQLEHQLPRLAADDRVRIADELAPRLRAVLTLLAEGR